jgi:hypothetical protein
MLGNRLAGRVDNEQLMQLILGFLFRYSLWFCRSTLTGLVLRVPLWLCGGGVTANSCSI